jgi:hypothetical protein
MFREKIQNKIKSRDSKKGFIILIAIIISSLLVSMGMFIANVAYKELVLSSSNKASQQAFFVADSVMECALRHDIRGVGFRTDTDDRFSEDIVLNCNRHDFLEDQASFDDVDSATSVYYVSFADDTDGSEGLTDDEIVDQTTKAYAKVIVTKYKIGTPDDKTTIKVYGHNKYSGVGQVERAIEVEY